MAGRLGAALSWEGGTAAAPNWLAEAAVLTERTNDTETRRLIQSAAAWLKPGGPLARRMSGFEVRPQQMQMARTVARVLADGGVALVEAGTGTGKSLAYLLPAAAAARAKRTRIVVSTNTINLQEQLLHKDVPLVQEALADHAPFTAATLKGWSNYVCLLRLEQSVQGQASLFPEERETAARLERWAADESHFGSRDELPFAVSDELWGEIHAESDTCVRHSCPFFERCFFFCARRRAQEADLVIANHHLVCADAAIRLQLGWETDISVLPGYDHVIFDEAHHLEDVVTEHFGLRFSRTRVRRLLSRVSGPHGLTGKLSHFVAQHPDGEDVQIVTARLVQDVPAQVAAVQQAAEGLFGYLAAAARAAGHRRRGDANVELAPGQLEPHGWRGAAEALERLGRVVQELGDAVRKWRPGDQGAEILAKEAEALGRRAVDAASDLVDLAEASDGRYVYWLDRVGSRGEEFALRAAPVEVGTLMQDALLSNVEAVVFTSATLSAGDEFDYFKSRLGLADWPAVEAEQRIPAPFDFSAQVLLGLPDDLPTPDESAFDEALAEALKTWLDASAGRAFLLFTSYRALEAAYASLSDHLAAAGMTVLKHGDGPRPLLLERFRRARRPVLFGTDSFWEGVDVPGAVLSLVVICRLPFRVPTDPVERARARAVEERGGDSFNDYSLPRAIMRFRQGFGRLIRTKSDRGAVIVADPRVHQRGYGRRFLAALPPCTAVRGDVLTLAAAVRRWLAPAPDDA